MNQIEKPSGSEFKNREDQSGKSPEFSAEMIAEQAELLSGSSRRKRQYAAKELSFWAKQDPKALLCVISDIIDALNRPEAQTRWECLDILSELVLVDARKCDRALSSAELALFDEENGLVRLAAMKFLCRLGASTPKRSEKVWPLIDEAIQCYHGDPEFHDMMSAVIEFSKGKLDESVKRDLKERMAFDAQNAKGSLKNKSLQIIKCLS